MNKVIIHISDLHVTLYKKTNKSLNPHNDSFLHTNEDEYESLNFIDVLTTKIKEEYEGADFILLVTGDISNTAEKQEFDYASVFLKRIISDLNIKLDNCLILPGDHDVHRRSLENELANRPSDKAYLLNEIKFKNFSDFYEEIKGKLFLFNNIIIDKIVLDSKIVLLGINSNFKIDNEGGKGFIPINTFKKEFEALKRSENSESINYIACWHHNFTASYDDTNSGQWDLENRKYLLAELERQNIKLILTGNEHTSNSKRVLLGTIWSSDCGTLTSKKHDATFKLYPIDSDRDVVIHNRIYALQKTNTNDFAYFWDIRNNKSAKQPEKFELYIENRQSIEEINDFIPHADRDNVENLEEVKEVISAKVAYSNHQVADKLYTIVKEKKLFHTGHFHWSETSRAHNWIDVSKLLETKEDLYFVKNAIIDVINSFKLNESCDLIIGLGYEGNIISSKASIKFNIPYTSLPYSYRYSDHHDYERKLNFDNKDANFKKVIIITDVVNDGRTIRKLIDKREKEFFTNVEEIIVVSLFYTGHQEINTNILNYSMLPSDYDFENDHEVNNIEFYTVKSLRVEKCPYGKNYRQDCFIFKDELSCVHLFYDPKD